MRRAGSPANFWRRGASSTSPRRSSKRPATPSPCCRSNATSRRATPTRRCAAARRCCCRTCAAPRRSRALEFHAGRLSAFADAFDRLEAAIFLLDDEARILERNRSAADLLASAGPLAGIEGRLSLRDPAARAEFDSALRLAAAGRTLAGDGAALTLKAEAKLYSAALMPMRGGERSLRLAGAKAAAMFCVREVRFAPAHAMANLARLYNLTRRECAVTLATVEIGGAREAAAALGLSENTVKSHLKAVFHKTRTSRQSDLVKLLAAAALPLS